MAVKIMQITDESEWLEKRKKYITSTDVASLFGLGFASAPTAYELWHIKRGLLPAPKFSNDPRIWWGKHLERPIAEGIAELEGWKLKPLDIFAHDDDLRLGSSFDYEIECPKNGKAIFEVKTVDYAQWKSNYIEDDDGEFIEAKECYELQINTQLDMLKDHGFNKLVLGVFIMPTREYRLLWRELDEELAADCRKAVKKFWESDQPPPPDLVADSDLLAKFQRANSSDSTLDVVSADEATRLAFDQACEEYIAASDAAKAADARKKAARSKIILALGDHNAAWSEKYRLNNKKSFRLTETQK